MGESYGLETACPVIALEVTTCADPCCDGRDIELAGNAEEEEEIGRLECIIGAGAIEDCEGQDGVETCI